MLFGLESNSQNSHCLSVVGVNRPHSDSRGLSWFDLAPLCLTQARLELIRFIKLSHIVGLASLTPVFPSAINNKLALLSAI